MGCCSPCCCTYCNILCPHLQQHDAAGSLPMPSCAVQGLNVGGGGGHTREVCLRLREAGREAEFLPYESILGTMLHELTHNIVG